MRRIVRKDNSRRKKILSIGLVLFLFMGIGYSVISSNLLFNGNIELSKYESPYLYDVLKKEALSGGLAKKYTGNHHDSFTEEPTKDIYHWYATSDSEGTEVQNKNNVIFAGHCWQMIRTTDTGGVKMIYNGESENGQCLNTRGAHVGYVGALTYDLNNNYWYGTDYTYDKTTNLFSICGTTEQSAWNMTTAPNLIGKYTCKSTSEDGTCSTLYLIESYDNSTLGYAIPLKNYSNYYHFGKLAFNKKSSSPAYVGYMYNTVYNRDSKGMATNEYMYSNPSLSTNYWYSDSISYDSATGKYSLNNPYKITSTSDYPSLVGKYTLFSSTQTYTFSKAFYIAAVNNTKMYNIELSDFGNHTLSDFNYSYTYGDSYTDNGNGTYTINNPTTIYRSDWYTSYSNLAPNKYVCKNAVNNTCSDLLYTTDSSETTMTYISTSNNYKYSKGFTWDGSKYVLNNDTSISFWNIADNTNKTSLNNAHYTCWNETGECTSVSYIFLLQDIRPYYINLTNGKSIDDAKNEMLYNNDVNLKDSTMKIGVDAWYKHYLLDYDDYLEETIYCNDRSQKSANTNGWNPNGGMLDEALQFKEYTLTSDLSCTNTTDQFSVSNNNAKLTYKVGLMSSPEMNLLNNKKIRKTGVDYWLMSPSYFGLNSGTSYGRITYSDGIMTYTSIDNSEGVRPAISLKPGTEFIYGNGSMEDPYVVKPVRNCTYNGDLTQGAEFVDGQYTYRYMQENDGINWQNINEDGWGVRLTDKESTDPVNTKLCTTINGKSIVSMSYMFYDSSAAEIDVSSFDTSNVTSMGKMFAGSQATTLDLRSFDTSKVTNMGSMFSDSQATSIDLSSFDTKNVADMYSMFSNSNATVLNLSNFDTRNVVFMNFMFEHCKATSIDVSSFNTKNVQEMISMFNSSKVTSLDISSFDNSNVVSDNSMFCNINRDIITSSSKFTFKDGMFVCPS